MEKENRFVKFHALQSILLHVGFVVLFIALMIIGVILGIAGAAAGAASNAGGGIAALVSMLIGLIWLVLLVAYVGGLIYAAVKSYGGAMFKLPIIGNMAEKFANK